MDESDTDPDSDYMLKVSNGDMAAFEYLVKKYQNILLNFFIRNCVNNDVEDLVQQTFIRLYNGRKNYKKSAKFSTYLFVIARSVRVDEIRKQIRFAKIRRLFFLENFGKVDNPSPKFAIDDELQVALQKLSEEHRETVILGYLDELPYAEIATIMNVPIGTVKSRMFHALRELRKHLGNEQ